MRIAQIAPLNESVPPTGHGAVEMIVSLLTEELVRRGHQVVLYASGDSQTAATLRSLSSLSFRGLGRPEVLLEFAHAVEAFRTAAECDVIHNHLDIFGIGLQALAQVPVLTTLHSPLETPGAAALAQQFSSARCVALSQAHRRVLPRSLNVTHVIPHGLPIEQFPFQAEKEDFLLFLGRIHPAKGPDVAIEAARNAGLPLVIAAHVDRYQPQYGAYWEEVIKPQVDGRTVIYVGEPDFTTKTDLLKRARALLMPIQWEEPFGLVMVEALACGTPVVALRRGAVPEILLDGETGFIAETAPGLLYGIRHAHQIDPRRCRQEAETRFSVGRMVDDYLAAYDSTIRSPVPPQGAIGWPEGAVQVTAAELAAFFAVPQAEAMAKLERAPLLLAEAWWRDLPATPAGRTAFLHGEPLWVYERANRSLNLVTRRPLADAVAIAVPGERWLSYRSDLASLALEGLDVDVMEPPGPQREFIAWRLARRRLPARVLADGMPAELPAETYDGIVALGGLELEDDPTAVLTARVRALRPGGRLFLPETSGSAIDQPWLSGFALGWRKDWQPQAFGLVPVIGCGSRVLQRPEA